MLKRIYNDLFKKQYELPYYKWIALLCGCSNIEPTINKDIAEDWARMCEKAGWREFRIERYVG